MRAQNGEITDPPAHEAIPNARYAQAIPRPLSPELGAQNQSFFCKTCLKNQHLVSETLAGYFPPQDAPDYAEYEKQYPKYRKELEARYPQVCEACEPKVKERIQVTQYAAHSDKLRRSIARTKGEGGIPAYGQSRWKSVGIFIGGTGWFLSLLGQLLWHGLCVWSLGKGEQGLSDPDESVTISMCLHRIFRGSEVPPECTTLADPIAYYSLILGLLCIWWNPRLRERFEYNGGRIIGIADYYKLQSMLLVSRWAAWSYLPEVSSSGVDYQKAMGLHLGLVFVGAIVSSSCSDKRHG